MRHEHPFDAAADRPAGLVLGEFANLHAGTIIKREIRLCPCRATLGVEHPPARSLQTARGQFILESQELESWADQPRV